jgi:hypothetical protein
MEWIGQAGLVGLRMGEIRKAYKILVGKPKLKRPLGRSRHKWVNNIKIDLKDIWCEGVD